MTLDEAIEEIASQSDECRRVIEQAKALSEKMYRSDCETCVQDCQFIGCRMPQHNGCNAYKPKEETMYYPQVEGITPTVIVPDEDIIVTKASPASLGIR